MIIKSNDYFEVGVLTNIGDRKEQEDSFGLSIGESEGIFLICDGMGGFANGKYASSFTADKVVSTYDNNYPDSNMQGIIIDSIKEVDRRISDFHGTDGEKLSMGTTIVTVLIEHGCLNWISVGDSRAYIFRGGEYAQLTKDQNYKTVLDEQIDANVIDVNKYNEEIERGDKLINYVGIGNLSLFDYSIEPFELKSGDVLLLISDGIYKLIDDDLMNSIVINSADIEGCLSQLSNCALAASRETNRPRDNITIMAVRWK